VQSFDVKRKRKSEKGKKKGEFRLMRGGVMFWGQRNVNDGRRGKTHQFKSSQKKGEEKKQNLERGPRLRPNHENEFSGVTLCTTALSRREKNMWEGEEKRVLRSQVPANKGKVCVSKKSSLLVEKKRA